MYFPKALLSNATQSFHFETWNWWKISEKRSIIDKTQRLRNERRNNDDAWRKAIEIKKRI